MPLRWFLKPFAHCAAAGVALSLVAPAHAAEFVQPPVEDALHERNVVAVLRPVEEPAAGPTRFTVGDVLWGEADERVNLVLEPDQPAMFGDGGAMLVVYSHYWPHRLYREQFDFDPERAHVVNLPVVGDAVFAPSVDLTALFTEVRSDTPDTDDILQRLLVLMEQPDSRTRTFAVFEFAYRPDLYPELSRRQGRRIRALLESRRLRDDLQEFLVTATQAFPKRRQGRWIPALCRRTIRDEGVVYDLASGGPLLVKRCATILGEGKARSDADMLAALLHSNSPGVTKAALASLIAIDAEMAGRAARETLAADDTNLHAENRRVLNGYLRELDEGTPKPPC